MAQATVAGGFIPVSNSSQAGGGVYTSIVPPNCTISLSLNPNDTGYKIVNIAYTQNGVKNYQDYNVTSTVKTVTVPANTSVIECTVQGGGGDVTAVSIQIMQNS